MPKNRNGTQMLNSSITTTKCQQSLVNSNLNKAMELHKVMEVMLVTTKRHHRHQYPQQTLKQQEIANLLKQNLNQEATRVTVNNKEASMVVTNSNKVTASNRLETGPSSSMVSRNHPNSNNRDNTVSNPRPNSSPSKVMDNNKVMVNKDSMDNSKVMDSNLNRDSTGNSKAAMASHRHLRAPASHLRDSSREVTAANRAKTKDTANSKDSNRTRGTVASRETRVKATDSSRAARTRGMDNSKVKDMDSNRIRVTASKVAREVTAREGPMLETVETRVADQVMVTTSPGKITRGETVLRPTGVAEDLTVEMSAKEGMTTEEAEEMTEEDTVVTAEEVVTWTDKVVLTGEITTEGTIEEGMTTGKEGLIIVETEATTQMEMIIRAAGHKRCNKKCRADHQATPFSSAGCPKMCPASKLVISSDKSASSRKTNELER